MMIAVIVMIIEVHFIEEMVIRMMKIIMRITKKKNSQFSSLGTVLIHRLH